MSEEALSFLIGLHNEVSTSMAEVHALHERAGALSVRPLGSVPVQEVRLPASQLDKGLSCYRQAPGVRYIEPSATYRILQVNDPYFWRPYSTSHNGAVKQWGLERIHAEAAWRRLRSRSTDPIRVAVIDTGVDVAHPDLYRNIARENGLLLTFNAIDESRDVTDEHGHGTHCAGILAAVTNNGRGVAALTCNTVELLPVKAMGKDGSGDLAAVARGIVWAVDHGARVLSLSLGGTEYRRTLQEAIDYAWRQGAVVLAAVGNDGNETLDYPAGCFHAVGVASVGAEGQRSSFSNRNRSVCIAAPGDIILSTTPVSNPFALQESGYRPRYDALSGTSMAAPLAAGLLALIAAAEPQATPDQLVQRLERSADAQQWTPEIGWGVIDARRAVEKVESPADKGAVVGRVTDRAGVPVGTWVHVGAVRVHSGPDGLFRLLLPAGTASVYVGHGSGAHVVEVVPGADTFVDVEVGVHPEESGNHCVLSHVEQEEQASGEKAPVALSTGGVARQTIAGTVGALLLMLTLLDLFPPK
ncbi:MAG: S8 family serine peptidase [Firmicutes bacterium]|nr:S8 family serine peptidase [Bacillota bacterium]